MKKPIIEYNPDQTTTICSTFFENTHEGFIITNEKKEIQVVNPAFSMITGYTKEESLGKNPSFLKSNRHEAKFYKSLWIKVEKVGRWNGAIWNRRKNGEIFLTELTVTVVKNGKSILYIGILNDQSSSKMLTNRQLNHDPLTNLPNRILFKDHLAFMIAHARRNNQILALLLLDLDRFKKMNDSLGHSAGDMILIETATRIKNALREVDAVFRLGNDEFAIVLEEVSKIEDVAKVASKILEQIKIPYKIRGYKDKYYISSSVGISIYPQDGNSNEELIKNAEIAMYQAKDIEQNYFQHYSPAMNASTFKNLTMEHQLHKAIEKKEFIVYFQPFIDIKSGKIFGAEALVRWKHPELGLISPAEFIPIAEETGLIVPIGEQVLYTACQVSKEWHDKGYVDFIVSVNLSARQFQLHDLLEKTDAILDKTGLSSEYLHLEITESIGMKNAAQTIKILKDFKARGISISIDDFGTGYSSLSYLKKFPIDILKIDQSFVRDISTDLDSESIVTLIISMAHTLKFKVIAEGVETETQLAFLKKLKCDFYQGYLFSRPVPAEDFEKLLKKNY